MMLRLRLFLIASALLSALLAAGTAFAQKPGGILQMPGFASPASMSIHEESMIAAGIPLMGVFNNLVSLRPARGAEQPRVDRSRLSQRLVMGRDRGRFDLSTASGRKMARRQAVHRRRLCWQPYVKGLTIMVDSLHNNNRYEDLWLDK
jgi:hypothetical protein